MLFKPTVVLIGTLHWTSKYAFANQNVASYTWGKIGLFSLSNLLLTEDKVKLQIVELHLLLENLINRKCRYGKTDKLYFGLQNYSLVDMKSCEAT